MPRFPHAQQQQRHGIPAAVVALTGVIWITGHAAFAVGRIRPSWPRRITVETSLMAEGPVVLEVDAPPENARKAGMALMLDDGTRKSHSMAESTQFVAGFFKGLSDRKSFSELVTSLYFVYEAMEAAIDATEDPSVERLDFAQLRRLPALEEDMEYFHGPSWRESITPSPATIQYCDEIRQVALENPYLLIGHQYSRYVGDLFGGQMMGGMAVKSLNLAPDGPGTSFYRFGDITDTQAFIQTWYSTLNGLDLSEAQKKAVVDEANVVFRLNIDVFEELEGSPFTAPWQLFVSSLKERLGLA